ncbi:hypothetical protein [Cytobacillus purgationiresistens]|uniref:Uncharacterized protein n=1 Tax=Cytobacillus purgationiresistens TaxID=863449 RepID=A0ABU0AR36_9BACI|nr:hypothetical protein [Cytobacillus purgationiresistens]MDQ0273746.1 hypothetical protein [Cytobacillus purgationiresistens]
MLVCLIGVYLSVVHWDAATTLAEMNTFTSYLIVFYTEFFVAGIGSFLLIRSTKRDYVSPWIALIVGTHFFFLVNIFKDTSLYVLAILMIVIAVLSPWLSRKVKVASSAITGIGSGTVLFCFAILGLLRYLLS